MTNITPLIFGLLALIFVFFAARDYWREQRKLSIAGKVWLRMAIIFAAVSILLLVFV